MLFVYGTLRDADMLRLVLGRVPEAASMRQAVAPGFRAVPYPGRVYPALTAAPADSAPGLVIEGLSPSDLAKLDAFEGAEYSRGEIAVLVEGRELRAETYLPAVAISCGAAVWSLAEWTLHHKAEMLAREAAVAARLG